MNIRYLGWKEQQKAEENMDRIAISLQDLYKEKEQICRA